MATWHIHNGDAEKKIDFFNISKRRNWVNNITNNLLANTRQNTQREMIKIQLQIKLKRMANNITSNNTIYDIKELRINPKKCKEEIEIL